MRLQPRQAELLKALCVAQERSPDDEFAALADGGGASLTQDGIDYATLPEWLWNDLPILERAGMIHVTGRKGTYYLAFIVTPEGFEYAGATADPKLRPAQVDLLRRLAQAGGVKSSDFRLTTAWQGQFIQHPGLAEPINDFAVSDLDELVSAGLVRRTRSTGSVRHFAITNKGWDHWEALGAQKDSVARIEDNVRRLLDPAPTKGPYAEAFRKWAAAEAMLWTAKEEPAHLTALAIVCRDTIQRFADAFAREQGHLSEEPSAKTINRVTAAIDRLRGRVSKRQVKLLDALEAYWRAVDGLVQRQVHAAEKGGRPVEWEDARLVVTQTALIMFELIRAVERAESGDATADNAEDADD